MNTDVSGNPDATSMPESTADAWDAVYIDVAEKLDAEDRKTHAGLAAQRAQ